VIYFVVIHLVCAVITVCWIYFGAVNIDDQGEL